VVETRAQHCRLLCRGVEKGLELRKTQETEYSIDDGNQVDKGQSGDTGLNQGAAVETGVKGRGNDQNGAQL
jgi:hypothetical protein